MEIPPRWEPTLAKVRATLAPLGEVEEFLSWGHPVWKVGRGTSARMFATFGVEEQRASVTFLADLDERDALLDDPQGRFEVPKYVGHRGWRTFVFSDPNAIDWALVTRLLTTSARLVRRR